MPNSTHRKRLARAIAEQHRISYMAALGAVTQAADAGRLPSVLDEAGMAAAQRIVAADLATQDNNTQATDTSAPTASTHANGGVKARTLSFNDIKSCPKMSMSPSHFRADGACKCRDQSGNLRPRQAEKAIDQQVFDLSFEYERLTGNQGLIYIESPGDGADRYRFGNRHTALGRREAVEHLHTLLADAQRDHSETLWDMPDQSLVHAAEPHPTADPTGDHNCAVCTAPIRRLPGSGTNGASRKWTHPDKHVAAPSPNLATYRTVQASLALLDTVRQRLITHGAAVVYDRDHGPTERPWHVWFEAAQPAKGSAASSSRALVLTRHDTEARALDFDAGERLTADRTIEHIRVLDTLDGLALFDPTTGELLTLVRLAPAPAITGPAADPTILRLDPHHDRLVGGPTHTKVYDPHDRRVNASCDICNRRLGIGESWWMVASPNRDWVNGMGVVCADHRPWLLPHDTVAARDDA